jgi:hypothetical protein
VFGDGAYGNRTTGTFGAVDPADIADASSRCCRSK